MLGGCCTIDRGMRRLVVTAALVMVCSAPAWSATGAAFRATFVGGGHTPPINTRWPYTVKVTDAKGKPLAARITAVVIDPIAQVHPVEFFANKKTVTNYPIKGTFRDAIIWPPESGGYKLTFRVTVRVGTAKKVLTYILTPQLPTQ
jgi:hypothetical protein